MKGTSTEERMSQGELRLKSITAKYSWCSSTAADLSAALLRGPLGDPEGCGSRSQDAEHSTEPVAPATIGPERMASSSTTACAFPEPACQRMEGALVRRV